MVKHFDHCTIVVRDVDRAKRFFGLLGFKEAMSVVIAGEPFASYMGVPGIEADHVKSRRQTRPCAPGAGYATGGHGTTAEDGACNLRTRLRLSPPLRVGLGVDERRNERRDDRDDE